MTRPPAPGDHIRIDGRLADDPLALIEISLAMVDNQAGERALALLEAARAHSGADPLLGRAARALASRGVPTYHAAMLADRARNAAYASAIASADISGKRVLDIGTGSGLLAMLSARAGAAQVVSCEVLPSVADTARRIVAANGLSGTVTVVTGHSTKLSVEELGGPFDVVVSEIIANDVVLEGVLPALRDAHCRLAAPGASFIPAKAALRVAAARFRRVEPPALDDVEGFDLRLFERHFDSIRFAKPRDEVALVGPTRDAILFDFSDPATFAPRTGEFVLEPPATQADGLAQWIRIAFGDGVQYENPPGEPAAWGTNLWQFDQPAPAGEPVAVGYWVQHDILRLWRRDSARPPGTAP